MPKSNPEIRKRIIDRNKSYFKQSNSENFAIEMNKIEQLLSQIFEKELDYAKNVDIARNPFINYNDIDLNELFCLIDEERKGYFTYEK